MMSTSRRSHADGEEATLHLVYDNLTTYLRALRDARGRTTDERVQAVINGLIDHTLASESAVLDAIRELTGRAVQDPY